MNNHDSKLLAEKHKGKLYVTVQPLVDLPYSHANQPSKGFDSWGLICFIFEEVFALKNTQAIQSWFAHCDSLPWEKVTTGDIVFIVESDGTGDLIPALAFGVLQRQIVYSSPWFQKVRVTDLSASSHAYDITRAVSVNEVLIRAV